MVNELRELLRSSVASPPQDPVDLSAVLKGGRRRVRRRRLTAMGGAAVASAAVIGVTSLVWSPPDLGAAGIPAPEGPTLRLTDAVAAVEGQDYRVLASHTNENLNADNGQYFDGVTDDGQILFRDGPRMDQPTPRYALMDPNTGDKTWLPTPPDADGEQLWPVALGTDRIVLTGLRYAEPGDTSDSSGATAAPDLMQMRLFALVYDRATGDWTRLEWPKLPMLDRPGGQPVGPNGRLYVRVPATKGGPPEGGWPTGRDGEADDSDAPGDTYELWSVSLTDITDARDEGLRVGSVAFTDTSMVWTDSTNGATGRVHVRDLDTGKVSSFDPPIGEKCNLLSFGATTEHVVMGQYCGTYAGGVRDDRVQVLDLDGDPVVTLQDSSIDGGLVDGSDVVTVTSHQRGQAGTYLYDLREGRFLRLSEKVSSWSSGGPTPAGQFLWSNPVNFGNGATDRLGELTN